MSKKKISHPLRSLHKVIADLDIGAIDDKTMAEFDAGCLRKGRHAAAAKSAPSFRRIVKNAQPAARE